MFIKSSLVYTLFVAISAWSFCNGQQIYINQVPDYYSLDSCAEPPLSTVVRNMYSGCGDGGRTTSFACFCTSSSSHFASVISTAVLNNCPGSTDDANSATVVFDEYCKMGATMIFTTTTTSSKSQSTTSDSTSTSSTSTASASTSTSSTPSASPSTITVFTMAAPTFTATAIPAASSSAVNSPVAVGAIAAGVTVPIVIIGIAILAGILIYRRRKAKSQPADHPPQYSASDDGYSTEDKIAFAGAGKLPGENEPQVAELPANRKSRQIYMQQLRYGRATELAAISKKGPSAELE